MSKKSKRRPVHPPTPRGKWGRIRFIFEYDDPRKELNIEFGIVWALHRVLIGNSTSEHDIQGLYDAYSVALFAIAVQHQLNASVNQQAENLTQSNVLFDLSPHIKDELLTIFDRARKWLFTHYPTAEDLLLQISYNELQAGRFNRAEAAEFASAFLDETIENDTWRKRLDKYIDEHGLASIKLMPGRPAKTGK